MRKENNIFRYHFQNHKIGIIVPNNGHTTIELLNNEVR